MMKKLLLAVALVAAPLVAQAEPIKFRINDVSTFVVPFQIVNATQLYSFEDGRGYPAAETPLFLFGSRQRAQLTLGAAPEFSGSQDMAFLGLQTRLSDKIFDTSDNEVFFGIYGGHREGEGVKHPKRIFNAAGVKASIAFF